MSGLDFLDTNILVYALEVADPRKHKIARPFLSKAVVGEFVTSTRVLAELANSLLQKNPSKFTAQDVLVILDIPETDPSKSSRTLTWYAAQSKPMPPMGSISMTASSSRRPRARGVGENLVGGLRRGPEVLRRGR